MDPTIDVAALAPGLLWLLMDTRKVYLDGAPSGRLPAIKDHMPPIIQDKKDQYRRDHDLVGAYVAEHFTNVDTADTDFVNSRDVKRSFMNWAHNHSRGIHRPTGAELDRALTAAFGSPPARYSIHGFGWQRWKPVQ